MFKTTCFASQIIVSSFNENNNQKLELLTNKKLSSMFNVQLFILRTCLSLLVTWGVFVSFVRKKTHIKTKQLKEKQTVDSETQSSSWALHSWALDIFFLIGIHSLLSTWYFISWMHLTMWQWAINSLLEINYLLIRPMPFRKGDCDLVIVQ